MWVFVGLVVLVIFTKFWFLPRYGTYTLGCAVLRQHDACDLHFSCGCRCHDLAIHQAFLEEAS